MSRVSHFTLGLLSVFASSALSQSAIEPPRRAVPPNPVTDPAANPPAEVPAAVPVPVPAPAPAEAAAKPPIATGLSPAQREAMKARALEARKNAPAGLPKPAGATTGKPFNPEDLKKQLAGGKKDAPTNPNASGVALSEIIRDGKPATLPNQDAFSGAAADPAGGSGSEYIDVFANPTATVEDVILDYEQYTGVTVIRSNNITGNVPIQVNPSAKMRKDEYVDYLKAALMVNGFAIHEYTSKIHVIAANGTGNPVFDATPPPGGHVVYTRGVELPEQEVFVHYFMKFDYISPQDAITILGQPQHQFGKITPVPNAGGILITESVPVIRSMIAIKEKIDIAPGEIERVFVQLKLADAEEVAQLIEKIIQQQNAASSKSGSGGGGGRVVAPQAAAIQLTGQLNPGNPNGNTVNYIPNNNVSSAALQAAADGSSVDVQADRRTNRILLSGKNKADIRHIEKLIHDLDVASEVTNLVSYQLRYISVVDFLPLATGALEARGFGTSSGGSGGSAGSAGGAGGGANRQAGGNGYAADPRTAGGSAGQYGSNGSSRSGSSGGSNGGRSGASSSRSGGGGGSSRSGTGGSGGTGGQSSPTSATVGKTLLISDPQSNSIIVSGPPESRDQIRLLIQQMDKHPLQVHIDCVIAELTVGDTMEFGLDLLRKVDNISVGGKSVDVAGILRNTSETGGIIDPATLNTISGFTGKAAGLNGYFQVGELINGYVKATEGTSRIKIIQKPSIAMANNEPGYISVGKQVPYPGSQQSSITNGANQSLNSTVEYKDVLLSLEVTPLINSKNEVTLQINQINDNVTGSTTINGNPIPNISQQELNTKLIVPNGGIAILGGLTADGRTKTNDGAPIIARIPILRDLFGKSRKDDSRRELMVFIQPRIMETADEMVDINAKEVQRNMVGPDAEKFIRPTYDTSDILLPQATTTIPFDEAGYGPELPKPGFWKRLGSTFKRKTSVPPEPSSR